MANREAMRRGLVCDVWSRWASQRWRGQVAKHVASRDWMGSSDGAWSMARGTRRRYLRVARFAGGGERGGRRREEGARSGSRGGSPRGDAARRRSKPTSKRGGHGRAGAGRREARRRRSCNRAVGSRRDTKRESHGRGDGDEGGGGGTVPPPPTTGHHRRAPTVGDSGLKGGGETRVEGTGERTLTL